MQPVTQQLVPTVQNFPPEVHFPMILKYSPLTMDELTSSDMANWTPESAAYKLWVEYSAIAACSPSIPIILVTAYPKITSITVMSKARINKLPFSGEKYFKFLLNLYLPICAHCDLMLDISAF